jgi:hypothetical protein
MPNVMPKTQIIDDQRPKQKSPCYFSLYLVKARRYSLYKGNGELMVLSQNSRPW